MGLGLTLPRDSRGFVFIHCRNPAGLGLMSRESHGYGMGHLRESCGVDGLEVLAELRVIASDKEANRILLWLLCDIDEELLSKVINVLQPFEDVLYSDKCPYLHLVTATKVHLQMYLTSNGRDLAIIGHMKSHLMTQLLHYFTVTDNAADIMTPDLKTRGVLTYDDRMCAE